MPGELSSEAWAKERLELAQPIEFPKEWPEVDRRISGEFLVEALLDSKWAKVPTGFIVVNTIIVTPLERRYAQVDGEICFEECVFEAGVELPYANWVAPLKAPSMSRPAGYRTWISESRGRAFQPSSTATPILLRARSRGNSSATRPNSSARREW